MSTKLDFLLKDLPIVFERNNCGGNEIVLTQGTLCDVRDGSLIKLEEPMFLCRGFKELVTNESFL